MKFFILLFFSGFLYAQEPQSNNSAQQDNTQGDVPAPSENTAPKEQPEPKEKQPEQAPPVENQQSESSENQKLEPSEPPSKDEKAPDESADTQATKPATQLINQPKVGTPSQHSVPLEKQPVPYYNPLHPQSPSAYQEEDLPSEDVSYMKDARDRKHRFSIGGKLLDYHVQGSLKKININASADYGYSRKYFEVGPYASVGLQDFDTVNRFLDEVMFSLGAFFEVNFMTHSSHAKNVPSIGLKAGYKRKQNTNYVMGQPYVSMKFFFNPQTALFVSLAPYYRYKLEGERGEWGIEIPTGLRFYFY